MRIEDRIGGLLIQKNLTVSTAESCTGGNIAALITSVSGSSAYYKGSIVAYDNEVKINILHVSPITLEVHGAVSEETVIEMAKGAMSTLKSDCAIASSGIAGPGGGTIEKPVGTIWIAAAYKNEVATLKLTKNVRRDVNIQNAVKEAITLLIKLIS